MRVQLLVDFLFQGAAKKSHAEAKLHVHNHVALGNGQLAANSGFADFERVAFPMGLHIVFSLQFGGDAICGSFCAGKPEPVRTLDVDGGQSCRGRRGERRIGRNAKAIS